MNRAGYFYVGLLVGVVLASGVFRLRRPDPVVTDELGLPAHESKSDGDGPQWWLLPKDFSLDRIFSNPEALAVLDAPERISIHRAGPGELQVLGHFFTAEGVAPTPEDAQILGQTFHSLNAYTPPSACAFNPGVLVRFSRGEHHLDVLICFSCKDLAWVVDDRSDEPHGGMGLSDLGIGTLRTVFRRVSPNDPAFKER